MAIRTWVRLLLATLGVGALAGASQLGLAYGLGIVRLTRVLDVTTRDQWTAQLAWVAWFAMIAAVVGALVGARLLSVWGSGADAARPAADPIGLGTVIPLALAAGLGAAIVVPLTMQPARTAQIAGVHPVSVIGICAGLGALVGVFAAVGALVQPVSRWSLAAVGLAIWAIAILSVAPSLAPDDPLPAVRLGVLDVASLSAQGAQRMALFTMPVVALTTGALLGWVARRQERSTLTIALAGLPGPALLTLAYLIAGPGAGSARYQVVPYWAAMTATGAGVLGSVLAVVLRRSPADGSDGDAGQDGDRPPLPRRPEQPESAIAKAGSPPVADEEPATARGGDAIGSAPATGPAEPPDVGDRSSERPGWRADSAISAPWDPPSGGPGGRSAASQAGSARPSADFFSSGRPPAPVGTGRSFRPSSWRRSGRKAGIPDPFATPTTDWPAPGPDQPPAVPAGTSTADRTSGGVAVGDYALGELPPFDGFARGAANSGKGAAAAPADHAGPHDPTSAPYVPAPATSPLPPEVLGSAHGAAPAPATGARSAGWTDDRTGRHDHGAEADSDKPKTRRWSRSRAKAATAEQPTPDGTDAPTRGQPLVPEPRAVSAPLPNPEPVNPPIAAPTPVHGSVAEPRRAPRQKPGDDDYVDWVSGLGSQ